MEIFLKGWGGGSGTTLPSVKSSRVAIGAIRAASWPDLGSNNASEAGIRWDFAS